MTGRHIPVAESVHAVAPSAWPPLSASSPDPIFSRLLCHGPGSRCWHTNRATTHRTHLSSPVIRQRDGASSGRVVWPASADAGPSGTEWPGVPTLRGDHLLGDLDLL